MFENHDPRRCCVLVPVGEFIEPGCETGLMALERMGYAVRRVRGYSQIDVARNALASAALRDGFEEILWIDSDIEFAPEDVFRLRAHDVPIACGIYPKKGRRELAFHVLPGTTSLKFGIHEDGLLEVLYVGTGFLHIRRQVFDEIQRVLSLPICDEQFGAPNIPFFMPMVVNTQKGDWYLGEDYAFCERARRCGFKVMADTRIRLRHVGKYGYTWEDVGSDLPRYGTYLLELNVEGAKQEQVIG